MGHTHTMHVQRLTIYRFMAIYSHIQIQISHASTGSLAGMAVQTCT